jgi:hypothetical protein
MQHVALNDSEVLARTWTNLLTSAALARESVPPSFISILGELSPAEAQLLASWATGRPDIDSMIRTRHANAESITTVGDFGEVRMILSNLERLMLLVPSQHASTFDTIDDEHFIPESVGLTRFGARFILACSAKQKA